MVFSLSALWWREGNDNPLQHSCLANPMDRGAWWAAVHRVTRSGTRLSDFTFTFHFHALEKEMPTHSSVLAWKIPGTGEPGGLPSLGSHRVGHDWRDLAAAAAVALWWKRIKGLWKLPDGKDWLKGKLGLGLMDGAMFSKWLIQFSVDGWSCVSSLLFTWDQTVVELMKIMVTSFKRPHACTATLSAPNPA